MRAIWSRDELRRGRPFDWMFAEGRRDDAGVLATIYEPRRLAELSGNQIPTGSANAHELGHLLWPPVFSRPTG